MKTINVHGIEHANRFEALQYLEFHGDKAISVAGRFFTVREDELRRIEALGIQPSVICWNEASQRLMTVPGRNG
jgi:hypothetical protein